MHIHMIYTDYACIPIFYKSTHIPNYTSGRNPGPNNFRNRTCGNSEAYRPRITRETSRPFDSRFFGPNRNCNDGYMV